MTIVFHALPTSQVRAIQAGGPDAYGHVAERTTSDGGPNPCRHCLRHVPKGAGMLILAHRPFSETHPYAETGPIFLCADECDRHQGSADDAEILQTAPDYLIKGYDENERIVYGTGKVVPTAQMHQEIETILDIPRVVEVHIRSSRNNCYQARARRA